MASSTVLKEFLVRIGFKMDEQQFRNFQEGMAKTSKNVVEMGKTFIALGSASAAALATTGGAITAVSRQLESLYFASQRTGASAKELQTFSFAAEQVGVSAERAQSAIEGIATARRTNPGLNGILGGLGIDPKQTDNAKVLVEMLGKLRGMPHFQGAQYAQMFGLDEQTFNQLEKNGPELVKAIQQREKMFKQAGLDPDKYDAQAHKFMNEVRLMGASLLDLSEIIAICMMPIAETFVGWIEGAVGWLTKADKETDGWSSKIAGLSVALLSFSASLGIFVKFLGMTGITGGIGKVGRLVGLARGAAVVGETAAAGGVTLEGGAAVAGGGLLATLLPVAIIAAVAAALVWMGAHPEQVRKAAGAAWDWTKKEAGNAWDAAKEEAHALPGQVKGMIDAAKSLNKDVQKAGGWASALSLQTGTIGDLARMTASFEGHVKNGFGTYKDVAGHLTAGFGHLVRAGEDLSHLDMAGAITLLSKDLNSALRSVHRLVKVHLGENQSKALADFVFNLGEDKFAKSTLLRKLNSGDFASAADQFQYWNKALNNGHLVVNAGLTSRRAAEAGLFRTPDKPVTVSQKTEIHVTGGDAGATGREVARQQSRVNGDMLRDLVGAMR